VLLVGLDYTQTSVRLPLSSMSTTSNRTSTLDSAPIADKQSAPFVTNEPLVVIEPGKLWSALDLRELWSYRELLYFLTWRDLKVRYKQAALGVAWVVMQPLASALIFTVFLGKLARVPSDGLPYPIFAYSGLILWAFFSTAVIQSGLSLVSNAHLITKVYFPRLLMPLSAVAARLVDFTVAFALLLGLLVYYRMPLSWSILALPIPIALTILVALAVGVWSAAINVKYRDVGVVLPVMIQLWMFVSPIVYPLSLIPESWRKLYALNPLVGILEAFRSALFGRPLDWTLLAISTAVTLPALALAAYLFRRMERSFADIV